MNALPAGLLFGACSLAAAAGALYGLQIVTRRRDLGFWAGLLAGLSWCALTAGGAMRWVLANRLLATGADRLLLVLWLSLTGYLLAARRCRLGPGGAFFLPLAAAGMAWALTRDDRAAALTPSTWMRATPGWTRCACCGAAGRCTSPPITAPSRCMSTSRR